MLKKLRLRFILSAMISFLAVLLIIIGVINILDYRNVIRQADRTLQMLAENDGNFPDNAPGTKKDGTDDKTSTTAKTSSSTQEKDSGPKGGNLGFGVPSMTADTPFEYRYFVVKYDSDGELSSIDVSNIAAIDDSEAEEYADEIMNSSDTHGFLSYFRYLKYSGSDGTMVLFLDCNRSLSSFHSFLLISIIVSVIGFVAAMLLVILLSRRFTRPMEESYAKQKRFITDAGHELKTPLTIIDADMTVLEMDIGKNEWVDDVRQQTKRLAKLTNDMVYLSKMDEENRQSEKIDFPLSDLVQEESQSFRSRAMVENKTFESEIDPMINYKGDEKAIRQLVSILLDNALKYSDEGGRIRVTLRQKGKGALLSVFNTTKDPMNPDDLSHLFDRFYRTDQSRSSETGGYGLGLSIAKAVVASHRGKITASSSDGRSLEISVLLP
ncbi:MAG: sensor histidine kinase [Bilifractor sp.]|jgi:two-component system sensor histidine kinase CiaH